MMHKFLTNNRDDLIARCKVKVARRPKRAATEEQLSNGIPMFLDQLTRTLQAEDADEAGESLKISGASGGDVLALSEIGVTAATHGRALLKLGFSVDQVVHDYGDICQAITDLAFERDAPFAIDEFRTLNRCLDNAIADAVTEFSAQRDSTIADKQASAEDQRIGMLVRELRNALGTATHAAKALEVGNLTMVGATGAVLNRSLAVLGNLIDWSVAEVEGKSRAPTKNVFSLSSLIRDAVFSAELNAAESGCSFVVAPVDPLIGIEGNNDLLLAALGNLIQNAFKFTHPHTQVALNAYEVGARVLIDIKDNCGGLPHGEVEKIFRPFFLSGDDKTGVGLGLSIARQNVEADGGLLTVRDVPGIGCVFTISLPRYVLH